MPFDEKIHEAISTIETSDPKQDHHVIEEVQKGYTLGETLIRTAKVVVGKLKA